MRISNTSIMSMQAFSAQVQASAHNVANVNTADFRPQEVVLETGPEGRGARIAEVREVPLAGVSLEREFPLLIETQRAFEANAAMIRTEDELAGIIVSINV